MIEGGKLRQAVLQYAVQGKLVPQDASEEPASALLERIAEKTGKKTEPVLLKDRPFEVPRGWVWCRLGDIFQHNTGKALNALNKDGSEMTYITTSNLYWNRFELDNLRKMLFTDSEIDKCTVQKGDLLVCEGGDVGRAAIWNYDYPMRIQNHIHRLRAYTEICTEYFYYILYYYNLSGKVTGKGIGIKGLSSLSLHNLPIPLPPLPEQARIAARLSELEMVIKDGTR